MPTYDYVCDKGHRFEVFQSMKDEALTECTECGGPARRLIGMGAGFLFKGDGFYITDYRSKEYKDKAKADTSKSTPESKSKDKKPSETKAPAGKKDASKGAPKGGSKKD